MKTLQEYILEAMSQEDFLKKIHDIYNDDYESAYNVLTKLYFRKDNKSFKQQFREFCDEKNILKIAMFWSYFDDFSGRTEMINNMLEKSGKDTDTYTNLLTIEELFGTSNENVNEIEISKENNIFNLIANKIYKGNNNEKLKTNFIKILKEIAIDDKRTKKTAAGKFEHLLTLFLDGKIQPGNGDVFLQTGGKTMHIEVKYCENSDFGAYKTNPLSIETLKNISNGKKLDVFLKIYLDKIGNDNDKTFAKKLKELFFPENVETDVQNSNNINENDKTADEKRQRRPKIEKTYNIKLLKQYFLCLQFYLYLKNQFKDGENNYLMLFKSVGKDAKNKPDFGQYKLVNVNKIIDKSAKDIKTFVLNNFIAQSVNRNKVEFTLK